MAGNTKSTLAAFSLVIALLAAIAVVIFKVRPEVSPGQSFGKPLEKPLVGPKIVISKSNRRLYLYSDSKIVRSYHIGLGSRPTGDKVKEGDGRTPEGQYYVCIKNPKSRYYLSLGLSYPNVQDAERGLREGLISREQYQEIAEAISKGAKPPWDTRLGGEIFIHGHGGERDWTLGCIALDDRDIRELYDVVDAGTPVLIQAGKPRPP
jgi:murein L,D-transpeptidase YafK